MIQMNTLCEERFLIFDKVNNSTYNIGDQYILNFINKQIQYTNQLQMNIEAQKRIKTESDEHKYCVYINRSSLTRSNHIKQRFKLQHMQQYKQKLNLRIKLKKKPPTEDSLANLTTKQLDDYIQLYKNRSSQKKQLKMNTQVKLLQKLQFKHPRIYQSSFLCKLNKLVKEHNRLNFQYQQNIINKKNQKKKQMSIFSPQFLQKKLQKIDGSEINFQIDQEKSVSSIPYDIDQFENNCKRNPRKIKVNQCLIWFEGMSKKLLKFPQKIKDPIFRGMDIQKSMMATTASKFRSKTCY